MRTKEVQDAIELLHNEILSIKEGLEKGWYYGERYNLEQEIKKKETVLNYISELEKYKRKHSIVKRHYVSKDEIKDKIKELEDKFDFFAGREHAEWQDGEFDGDVCDDIALQIKVLKELLEGE